jgi:putative mRNA 3-end processing factor
MVTHGSVGVLVRHLREQGLDAQSFDTEYGDDDEENAGIEPEKDKVLA